MLAVIVCLYTLLTIVVTREPSALADHYLSHSCGKYVNIQAKNQANDKRRNFIGTEIWASYGHKN